MKKIFLTIFLLLTAYCLLLKQSISASETTFYFGSLEKTYDDAGNLKETKTYISAGSATVVRTTNNQQPTNNKTEYIF